MKAKPVATSLRLDGTTLTAAFILQLLRNSSTYSVKPILQTVAAYFDLRVS